MMSAAVEVRDVTKVFQRANGEKVFAVNGVSFEIDADETLGLIGESGSGKSTIGRIVLGLIKQDAGEVLVNQVDIGELSDPELRRMRAHMQIVFQQPYESLNPRMSVEATLTEPLRLHAPHLDKRERAARVGEMLGEVGLDPSYAKRYPKNLSGGQQQRIGIARALITGPKVVVLDEPTSSLDLSVRAQILLLLRQLQEKFGLTYLFISHDIATVGFVADRIAVMYLGRIVETGPTRVVLENPLHPYTRGLLSGTLTVEPGRDAQAFSLAGEIPDPTRLPQGCPLVGRCPMEINACSEQPVDLKAVKEDRLVACIRI